MRLIRTAAYPAVAAVLAMASTGVIRADQQLLTFVFGPSSQQTTRQGAHAAASAAHHWLQTAGAEVELRSAGKLEPQPIAAHPGYKELEQAFDEAALAARDADPPSFLNSLEAGVQASAMHPGTRVVVAVLNTPPFSSEGERTLARLVETCRAKAIRVLVLDIEESGKSAPDPALAALATKSGGLWLNQAHALEGDVMVAASAAATQAAEQPAASPVQAANAAAPKPAAPGAIPQFEIPVHIRFVRTSGKGALSGAIAFEGGSGNDQAELSEETRQANESLRPMQGFIVAEAPLNALKFSTDDNTSSYQARARIVATIRNEKGVAVWTGRKEVNLHGPTRKLDMRREGSLFFMRSATLPRGSYTLEAKVEDLIGDTSGEIKTPLRTSVDAPGLVASDVLAVRPYRGSADRFEADQVLAYEGDALAPVLEPVFRADQPINMEFYMVLYPDIHGALPDLSMEILHEGRVLARMPLQFKSGLAKTAMEGKFSTMQGYGTANGLAIAGGQAKEFPYVADIKGAKFSPGNYEAVISIRQGKQIIRRTSTFRVEGNAPVQVASTVAVKGAAGPPVDEYADVVLPEIEPATIDTSGLKMRAEEQKRLWDEAAKNAMSYLSRLPNFRCTQETRRFTAPLKTPDQLKEADSFKSDLIYEDGKERYRTVEINGVKVDNTEVNRGIYSRSEFGSMLRGLFDPDTAAKYKWAGRAMAMGVLCEVFAVDVARTKSNFVLRQAGRREPAGYTGRVFIDEDTGMVRRLTIEGNGLPADFGLKSPALSLDYGMVRIGQDDYLLPLRSVLQLRHAKAFVRNETLFTHYRRFSAESEIKFQN
ncbi:MAG TPA: hypothetical protein VMI94_25200 [Bryobacteraceae bacterium]|nr:hypothetical protein [Bryobacteraceae bacterium]